MKIFSKNIDGNLIIKPLNNIILFKNGFQIIGPTEDMVLEDGWVLYESKMVDDLDSVRNKVIDSINFYDSSNFINLFYFDGTSMWFDKQTRLSLRMRFESELRSGLSDTLIWYNNISHTIKIDDAINMLDSIEIYAASCFDVTQRHIYNVNQINDIDELKNYDYRSGYPKQLIF